MNNFSDIVNIFERTYPELRDLNVKIAHNRVTFSSFDKLLPFLTYTNTLDEENRIIFLTHSHNSEHYKLLPSYILLSVLKKQIQTLDTDTILGLNGFEINCNGNVCKIVKVDLYNHKIITNSNSQKKIEFNDFITSDVRAINKNSRQELEKYKGKIRLYESQKTTSVYDLLNCVKSLNMKPKGGLLLFTQKSKFELLCDHINIGNKHKVYPIKEWIPIQKAIYKKHRKNYVYKWLEDFQQKYPLVVYADYTDIGAIDLFLEKYDYLDTVVFDDADKSSNAFKIKDHLSQYKNLQNTSNLRDIYIISSITSRDFHSEFEKEKSNNFNWSSLYNIDYSKYLDNIEVRVIENNDVQYCDTKQKELIDRLKSLNNFFEFREIAPIFITFHDIKRRLNTFYCPKSILQAINEYADILFQFSEKSGMANRVEELFNEIISNFKKQIDTSNLKLQALIKLISTDKTETQTLISSSNSNRDDIEYLMHNLKMELNRYRCYTHGECVENEVGKIYYLDFRSPISDLVFLENMADKVTLLIFRHETAYYKYKYRTNLNYVSRSISKNSLSTILNISDNSKLSDLKIGIDKDIIESKIISFYDSSSTKESSVNDLLSELYADNNISKNSNASITEDNILIWFSDGSYVETNKGTSFYKADDSDIDNLSELKVQATDLTKGDTIFIRGIENKSFREEIYESLQRNEYYRTQLYHAERWRVSLNFFIQSLGLDRVHKLLAQHGIKVNKITVQNWEYGNTILPNSISRLIDALNKICEKVNFSNQRINKQETLQNAKMIKKVIIKLPQLLLKKTISEEINLNSSYLEDDRLNELLSNLSTKVKIKQVQEIIKNI